MNGLRLKKREYELLNLARFIGAFWVVLFHANIHFGALDAFSAINPVLNQGVLGMTLFFVLSGFVLSLRYTEFEAVGSTQSFYHARIARLYPVYLFMAAVTLPTLFSAAESYAFYQMQPLLWYILVVAILVFALQAWAPALFNVWNFGGSWSLSVEAFFYATFPKLRQLISLLPNRSVVVTIILCNGAMLVILLLLAAQQNGQNQSSIFYLIPIFRFPEFVLGVAVFVLCVERNAYRKYLTRIAIIMIVVGFFLIYQINLPGLIDFGFLFALPFAMLYVHALRFSISETLSVVFNYLGHISYCLYIVQFGTVPYLKFILGETNPTLSWFIFITVTFFAANGVYYLIELPAHSYLKAKFNR